MTLGEIVKEYRERRGISQREFAKMAGLSNSYISQLENNQNTKNGLPINPSIETMKQVADAMDCTLDDIIRLIGDGFVDISSDGEDTMAVRDRIMQIVSLMNEKQQLALLEFLRTTVGVGGK